MRSRLSRKKKVRTRQRSRVILEKLDSRVLLSASWDWIDFEGLDDLSDFSKSGYGTPNAFYSDPATWGSDSFDLSAESDYVLTDGVFDQQVEGEPLSELSEPAAASGVYTLYLDFDGATVYSRSGDFWLGSQSVDIPAYDLDQFGWSGREAESIDYITNFVRDDYAPYNVDVTSDKPSYGQYSTIYVGGTGDWFRPGSSIIGVATYDIGNRDESNFGFAFTEQLGIYQSYSYGSVQNFSEYVANLVSHEAAHTFGSNHVSDTSATMNPYLPISPRTTSYGADSTQDTQTLLGNNLGYSHGPDDYGDDITQAQTIDGSSIVSGLLERRDDVDAFSFVPSGAGTATIAINTTDYSNLDSYLTVYDSGQQVVALNDDYGGSYDSLINLDVEAGELYTIYVSSSSEMSSGTYYLELTQPEALPDISVSDSYGSADDRFIEFDDVIVGLTTSATFTIANSGSVDLVISRLTVTGDFDLSVTGSAFNSGDDIVITGGSEQTITVTFEPGNAGSYEGCITIVGNDADEPIVTVGLQGQALEAQPDIAVCLNGSELTGNRLDFGNLVRNTSASAILTVSNNGSDNLTISDIDIALPFVITAGFDGDEIMITPGESVDLIVEVTGQQRGELWGLLNIESNDPDEQLTLITLNTQITGGVLSVSESYQSVNDGQIDFGTIYLGEEALRTITLVNSGDALLRITDLSVDSGFTLNTISDDDAQLAPGESLVITVGYAPSGTGELAGDITITTDNSESPVNTISLNALGQSNPLEITETDGSQDGRLSVGKVRTGRGHEISAWDITNHGNVPMTVSLALAGGSDYQIAGAETVVIEAGETYTVDLTLETNLARSVTDTLTITANDYNGTTETLDINADAYAIIGGRERYTFTDQDGDRVTISLRGSAQAEVTIGSPGQPDIESINLISGDSSARLKIKVAGGGSTELGLLTGQGDLKTFRARDVDLVDFGIDLDGQIYKLRLANVLDGADIDFDAERPAKVRIGNIIGDSDIDIDGAIRSFYANEFTGGTLTSDSIFRMKVGQLDADIEVTDGDLRKLKVYNGDLNGSINVSGRLGSVKINRGDLLGNFTVNEDIGKVVVSRGDILGSIRAGASIGKIKAVNFDQADIYAYDKLLSTS